MKFALILLSIGLWSGTSMALGFTEGDEFSHTELSGVVYMTCLGNSRPQYRTLYCDAYEIDPVSHDYFEVDNEVDATHVELRVEHPGGKLVKKKIRFDSEKGRSKKRFNLWIRTLFQKPLLHFGNNNVEYTLLSKKRVVREGNFQVRVNDAGTRQCRTRSMTSYDSQDCNGDSACGRYFSWENNCKY